MGARSSRPGSGQLLAAPLPPPWAGNPRLKRARASLLLAARPSSFSCPPSLPPGPSCPTPFRLKQPASLSSENPLRCACLLADCVRLHLSRREANRASEAPAAPSPTPTRDVDSLKRPSLSASSRHRLCSPCFAACRQCVRSSPSTCKLPLLPGRTAPARTLIAGL